MRFEIFKDNYKLIQETNAQNLGFTLGLNSSADLTHQEFASQHGFKTTQQLLAEEGFGSLKTSLKKPEMSPAMPKAPTQRQVSQSGPYPFGVDWQKLKRSNPPRNTGACQVHSLFTAVSALESSIAVSDNIEVPKLSHQYVMDCIPGTTYCKQLTQYAYSMFLLSDGTPLEAWDPYTGTVGKCPDKSKVGPLFRLKSYDQFDNKSDYQYSAYLDTSPFIAYLQVSPQVRFYQSGILNPTDCSDDVPAAYFNVDGYQTDRDFKGYYIIKASLGTGYGQNGNIWLKKDPNARQICGFRSRAFIV